jgi:hypothetical protein
MAGWWLMFVFNRDYNDTRQVEEFLPEFQRVYDDVARGNFAYDADFEGRIPGIAGPNERTAIYLLQGLRRERIQDAKVAALIEAGYQHVDELGAVEKFDHVVLYPTRRTGGSWAEFREARIVPDDNGKPRGVLPKGKRTHGMLVSGRAVLAR